MLGTRFQILSRSFQVYSRIQGSSLREKLSNLQQRQVVLNKSSKELKRLEAKKRLEIKKTQKRSYPRQKAIHLIRKQNQNLDQDLKAAAIGPTSDSDLKYLLRTRDKRLIYTILGTTGEQLRDSLLVDKDVKKFLRRGLIEKAVLLTRLAKHRGSAGMNSIMKYFFHESKAPQSAVDLYNWRKKWGVPPNEFTNTILFDGLARQENPIKKANATLVLKAVDRLIENEELSQIEFNAALGALSNCNDITHAFELFERKTKGVKRDSISYLWILRACRRVESDSLFQDVISSIMEDIPTKLVDAPLLFEFCKVLHSRVDNVTLQKMTVLALKEYFEIDYDTDLWPKFVGGFQLSPLSHWSIDRRYPLNAPVVGLFLDNCLQSKQYALGLQFFEYLQKNNSGILDLDMYHKYMELQLRGNPLHCGDRCLEIYEEVENNSNFISSKHSLVLLYKAFERQAAKKANNVDEVKINGFLSKCLNAMKAAESIYSKEFNTRLYPTKSWQFIYAIVKAANTNEALSNRMITMVIDEYLRSLIHGQFSTSSISPKNGENRETLRFVELECVRLLNQLAFRMSIPGIEEVDISKPSLERDIFLQRRQLRQFKNILLEHVDALQSKHPNLGQLEQLDSKLKEKALKILDDHRSNEYINYVLVR
ncbi:hypothetical protein ZYGR_0AI03640 [Zygosaccharomyces rouxii]|uniref:Mitochondrial group I intron splicing factor CCM1 n=1 Tax=Zygosaccharomyces rouxii TaxID=4956 RepID=A0A1Q3ABM8_ZYGRO|nr:hypothetical protein ZYGR_0AI03640 [Zygosaccharomyces rouxii]